MGKKTLHKGKNVTEGRDQATGQLLPRITES